MRCLEVRVPFIVSPCVYLVFAMWVSSGFVLVCGWSPWKLPVSTLLVAILLCSRQCLKWGDVGEERNPPPHVPLDFRGAFWVPFLLQSVADIVKNTNTSDLTFMATLAFGNRRLKI